MHDKILLYAICLANASQSTETPTDITTKKLKKTTIKKQNINNQSVNNTTDKAQIIEPTQSNNNIAQSSDNKTQAMTNHMNQATNLNRDELIVALNTIAKLLQTPTKPQPKSITTEIKELYNQWNSNKFTATCQVIDKLQKSPGLMFIITSLGTIKVWNAWQEYQDKPVASKIRHSLKITDGGLNPECQKAGIAGYNQIIAERSSWIDRFIGRVPAQPNKSVRSFMLMGPPGTGKTFFAQCMANQLRAELFEYHEPTGAVNMMKNFMQSAALSDTETQNNMNTANFMKFMKYIRNRAQSRPIVVLMDECDRYLDIRGNLLYNASPTTTDDKLVSDPQYYQTYVTTPAANITADINNHKAKFISNLLDSTDPNHNIIFVFTTNYPHKAMNNILASRFTRLHIDHITNEQKISTFQLNNISREKYPEIYDRLLKKTNMSYRDFMRELAPTLQQELSENINNRSFPRKCIDWLAGIQYIEKTTNNNANTESRG